MTGLAIRILCGLALLSGILPSRSVADEKTETAIKNILADDVADRLKALKTLQKNPPAAKSALPKLIEALQDFRRDRSNTIVSQEAARVIVAIGEPAHESLLETLRSDDLKTFAGAAACLQLMKPNFPDGCLELLLKDVESADGKRLWFACRLLAEFGSKTKPALKRMLAVINYKPDPPDPLYFQTQTAAVDVIAAMGPAAAEALPTLLDVMENGITSVRGHAATAVGNIGIIDGHDSVGELVKAANEIRSSVRERAFEALGDLGEKAAAAQPGIRKLMLDEEFHNRSEAAVCYCRIGGEPADSLDVLSEMLDSMQDLQAIEAYRALGPLAKDGAARLLEYIDHKSPDIRMEVALSLEQVAPEEKSVRAALKKMARSEKDLETRAVAKTICKRLKISLMPGKQP